MCRDQTLMPANFTTLPSGLITVFIKKRTKKWSLSYRLRINSYSYLPCGVHCPHAQHHNTTRVKVVIFPLFAHYFIGIDWARHQWLQLNREFPYSTIRGRVIRQAV
jgi:hypothetical protein